MCRGNSNYLLCLRVLYRRSISRKPDYGRFEMSNARQVRHKYPKEDLITMFVKRLDDDLFRSVGVKHMTVPEQRKLKPHAAVWCGYEKILGVNK